MDMVDTQSCGDLCGFECEGWLWLKEKEFSLKWCVLRDNTLSLFDNDEAEKSDFHIQILDSRIRLVAKSKSKNEYFKIQRENSTYLFGTRSHSDFSKWIRNLHLSAAGIKIGQDDATVSGFYKNTSKSDEEVKDRRNSNISNDEVFEKFNDEVDHRFEISFDASLQKREKQMTPSELEPRPSIPPRKRITKDNISLLNNSNNPNITATSSNSSVSLDNTDEKIESLITTETNDTLHKSISYDTSQFSKQKSEYKYYSPKSVTSIQRLASFSEKLDSKPLNPSSSSLCIDRNWEIVTLKRKIRDKESLVKEIDEVLKHSHLPDSVSAFWDEHCEQILMIISKE